MKKRPFSYYLSTSLIIISLIGFGIIAAPLIKVYFFPPQIEAETISKEYSLWIPKIKAIGTINKNVDPWNERIYKEALKTGIAHAKGTALPGQDGTVFLFAHSSGTLWEQTRYNTVFLRLHELIKGDSIEVYYQGKKYLYSVREKKEVEPQDVRYLVETNKTQLILQTCTPVGTDWKRLLIFADPIKG